MFSPKILTDIRARFHHVDCCPYQGERIFFENAGGSLTLKSVVEVNTKLSSIPDNQGRDNPASAEMGKLVAQGKADMLTFLGVNDGVVFVGESGTECLFRVIQAALLAKGKGGRVLGSTLEHPATASAAKQWSSRLGAEYVAIPHDAQSGTVSAEDYRKFVTPDTCVATVIQSSPVTGTGVDIVAVSAVIRSVSPECFIVVDGIQHAPHGDVHIDSSHIDAYAVSGYKVFSRHNYGFAWLSKRLSVVPHNRLDGTADDSWELGTRDAGAYATFSKVVDYLDWLGGCISTEKTDSHTRRDRITAAGKAIMQHEKDLLEVMLRGTDSLKGLAGMPKVFIIGGSDNLHRKSLVSLTVRGVPSAQVVRTLSEHGIRVHIRKNDHFSGNILTPLNLESCVRVSICHYNTVDEVKHFLRVMQHIAAG